MPARELVEWQTFATEEPIGEFRGDLRAGIIAAAIVSAVGGRAARPVEFMPFYKPAMAETARRDSISAAAEAHNAILKATARLKHHIVRRKKGQ